MDGVVADFDEHAGFGHVVASDGTRYFFHCTRIADGTRTIAVDTRVTFEVEAGHSGQWEATSVAPLR
jgi:cold shock CspA family protein